GDVQGRVRGGPGLPPDRLSHAGVRTGRAARLRDPDRAPAADGRGCAGHLAGRGPGHCPGPVRGRPARRDLESARWLRRPGRGDGGVRPSGARAGGAAAGGVAATGIQVAGSRVQGVETTRGLVSTPLVVNAAGPAARQVGRMVGLELPVAPCRRHIFFTEPFPAIPGPVPLTIDSGSGFYFRKEQERVLLSPGDVEDRGDDLSAAVDWGRLEEATRKAVRRVPVLERAAI